MSLTKSKISSLLIAGLSALSFGLAAAAQADTVQTRIFRIEAPTTAGMEHQILTTHDGRVYFVAPSDLVVLGKLTQINAQHLPASLVLDGDRVIDAQPLSAADAAKYSDAFDQPRVAQEARDAMAEPTPVPALAVDEPPSLQAAHAQGYQPTIFNSLTDVQSLFGTERELKHHSQCYERAEVWTREFQQTRGVQSMKVFMFFTSKFRQRYTHKVVLFTRPYKWWFHVAPFVYLGNQEYVLDREFLDQAVPMDDWTFKFIGQVEHDNTDVPNPTRSEAICLDAAKYTEYSEDPRNSHYCILRKVPMYYFQPQDIEQQDARGGTISDWRDGELKQAYKNTTK